MIVFDRFSWRFAEASALALRNVSLHIRRGEFVVIIGPSGSGKTTLALAMCGLLIGRQPGKSEGRVTVDAQDVRTTPLHRLAQSIGLVQQNPNSHFATLTVADEIAFGMENRCEARDAIKRRSTEAMELLAIGHLGHRYLSTLSGGEKQRVAVASIVAGDPGVIVLDEPTASLDPEASRTLFHSLAHLHRSTGLTVVIIEHKLADLLPLNPRLVRMEGGEVVGGAAGGPHGVHHQLALVRDEHAREHSADPHLEPGAVVADLSQLTVERDGAKILTNVSLSVRAGEVVAVLGPTAGGKSTLLECLHGLIRFVRGTAHVCGMGVSKTAVSELARYVGFVFQNADDQLVTEAVWEESLFTSRNLHTLDANVEHRADVLLERAGLSKRKADHPFRLSWGEKRRLNLVSAILHQPRLLLLDEPFAGQDWDNALFLLEAIRDVLRAPPRMGAETSARDGAGFEGACLLVTHDPRVVSRICTRLVFLSEGRVLLDEPLPQAFERLLAMGRDAYVPADCSGVSEGIAEVQA